MKPAIVDRHESLSAFVAAAEALGPSHGFGYGRESWDLGMGWQEACRTALTGDPSLVGTATDAINRVQA